MALSQDQETAAVQFLDFLSDPEPGEMVIAGHSGTGKTYLTKHLIDLARKSNDMFKLICNGFTDEVDVECTATTNKAARVLGKSTGEETKTIHNLLGLKVTNNFQTGKTSLKKTRDYGIIENTLVIIDEASMIDQYLLKMIRESTKDCKVLYVGDPYQLAPVFENTCPVFELVANQVELTTIQRQAEKNPIIREGDKLRQTVTSLQFQDIISDGCAIHHVSGPEMKDLIELEFTRKGRQDDDAQILAWTNDRVRGYNTHVRGLFTADEAFTTGEVVVTNKPIIGPKGMISYSTDERATVTEVYDAIEYDIEGWWITLDNKTRAFLPKNQKQANAMIKAYARAQDWEQYFAFKDFFADLRPIHACTVHKSQGSTYKKVFIDLADIARNNKPHEVARMLYVALTRASHQAYLYGELPAKYKG